MALLDIFKMKKLGGTVLLKDNSFLYISKVTGTQFEEKGKDMRILYEDGNGKKKEFMISQVKEAHPVEQQPHPLDAPFSDGKQPPLEAPFSDGKQSVFTLLNNMNKLKECEGYFITNDGNRIDVYRVLEFNDMKVTWIGNDDRYQRTADFRYIKEAHITSPNPFNEPVHKRQEDDEKYKLTRQTCKINLDYVPPETLDKNLDCEVPWVLRDGSDCDYEKISCQPLQDLTNSPFTNDLGSFKKRKIAEVPLMDDDLEQTLNRTKEINYKLIEDLIDAGVDKFEFASQTVPNDVYEILFTSKGNKKWFAVLQNDNEDVFILDMNSLFIVNAIFDKSKPVQSTNAIPTLNTSVEEPSVEEKSSVKIETKSQDYPGGPWFLNKRRKLDVSSVQDIIRGDNCKSIIVPGEPSLYNAYLNRDLKETMIENLIKKELSNDLNILLSETEGKDVLIYLGDDTKPHTLIKIIGEYEETYGLSCASGPVSDESGPVSDISQPNIENIEIIGNDVVKVKTTPLPAHLKCLAPTRYTEDVDTSTETYFTPKKKREVKVPNAPRKQTQQTFKDPANLNINDMVTFVYKGEEKRVLVKESNDKYLEGICQEQNKYKKYLVRYIEKVVSYKEPPVYSSSDDDTDIDIDTDAPEESRTIMPYKRMVLNAIKDMYVNGTKGSSRQAIQAYLMANYNHHINVSRFQDNLRRALKRLVETGCIIQTKQKFKLGDEGRKYLKKFTLKELKPVKKSNPVQPTYSNSKHDKIQSKTDLIQYAIDNEKILDIIYGDGSIPDIKRPIRPLKIFKTAYSKKEILQAICLIDDNIKNFTLDKVQIITFIEE